MKTHQYNYYSIAIALFLMALVFFQPACTTKDGMLGSSSVASGTGNGKGFGGEKEDPPASYSLVRLGNSKIRCEDVPANGNKSAFSCKLFVMTTAGAEVLATGFAEGISFVFSLSGLSPAVEQLLDCHTENSGLAYQCSYDAELIASEVSFTVLGTTSDINSSQSDTVTAAANISPIIDMPPNSWAATNVSGAPSARYSHYAVWANSKMIVWGGNNGGTFYNDGYLYDPVSDSWSTMNPTGAPSWRWMTSSVVWSGSKLIVWGGWNNLGPGGNTYLNDGALYNPVDNSWTAMETTNAPSPRDEHSTIWTGTKMVVWGGSSLGSSVNDGGKFDPEQNTWTAIETTGAPVGAIWHSATWTGSKMIVWGGLRGASYSNVGGQYDPANNTWSNVSTTGAPVGRRYPTVLWTGSKMVIWGGRTGMPLLNDGALFNPTDSSWSPMSTISAPTLRNGYTAVWSGSKMIVWGGYSPTFVVLNDGRQYNPGDNSWSATALTDVPSARRLHAAVWTGSRMIVWGGINDPTMLNTGGIFYP